MPPSFRIAALEAFRRDVPLRLPFRFGVVTLREARQVFLREPVPADHPVRECEGILLSSHRAGGLRETYALLSEMLIEDIELILADLPPVRLQRADPRTASLGRSR